MKHTTKEVMLQFLYLKLQESKAIDEDGNVKEQEVVDLGCDCHLTVAEVYELISHFEG